MRIYGNRKESSQNPYLGSFEETSSPLQKKKETQNFIDPSGDHFGHKLSSNERYNQELQYQLMHRTETLMNVNKAKAVLCDEQQDAVDGDDIDYQPFNVRRKKAQKTAQSSPAKE
mgnify:CR=1 FL=1